MEFTGQEMTFEEADRRYADLRRRRDAGEIGDEKFDAERQQLMVRDVQGVWWAKGREANEWFYRADSGWVAGMPPPPYEPPKVEVDTVVSAPAGFGDVGAGGAVRATTGDASGGGAPGAASVPPEILGFNWGAFLLNWIWAFGNRVHKWGAIGLGLSVIGLGIIPAIVLGLKGNEWAWHARRWNSVGKFKRTQKKWTRAGLIVLVAAFVVPLLIVGAVFALAPSPSPDGQNEAARTLNFQDDFSDTSSGWPTQETESLTMNYADGGYRIDNPPPPGTVTALAGAEGTQDITDSRVQATATPVEAPDPGEAVSTWGLVCRAADENNHYGLGVGADGSFSIYKMVDGSATNLATGEPDGSANTGSSSNQIAAGCVGNTLTLYVNGQETLEAQDSEFASGGAGLFVGNVAEEAPGTEVTFDDFEVSEP